MSRLVLRNPLYPVHRLREEMDRAFGNLLRDDAGHAPAFPALRVWEDGESVFVEAELPGMKLENLNLYVKDRTVTIEGSRLFETKDGESVHRHERWEGNFRRALSLPVRVNADQAEAKLVDGILTLTLPRAESDKPRKITVQAG